MPLVEVKIEAIENGNLLAAVNDAINKMSEDAVTRPHIGGPRKVKVEIAITPSIQDQATAALNLPTIDWKVSGTPPSVGGMTTRASVDPRGRLMINTNDPVGGDPNPTLFDRDRTQSEEEKDDERRSG